MSHPNVRRLTTAVALALVLASAAPALAAPGNRPQSPAVPQVTGLPLPGLARLPGRKGPARPSRHARGEHHGPGAREPGRHHRCEAGHDDQPGRDDRSQRLENGLTGPLPAGSRSGPGEQLSLPPSVKTVRQLRDIFFSLGGV